MEGQPAPTPQQPPPQTRAQSAQPSSLSNSEPTLRFPRPLGNRRLAKWISTSDPDIMHLTTATTASESGLAESTYELISGTDNESQEDNYTESMGGSVGSLDFHRPDDVHSLTGTEYTHDADSALDDGDALPSLPASDRENEEVSEYADVVHELEADADQIFELDASESDEEAHSRCSLEYTQDSLGTPSILTPEASRLVGPAELEAHSRRQAATRPPEVWADSSARNAELREMAAWIRDNVADTVLTTLPSLLFVAAFALLIPVLYTPPAAHHGPEAAVMTSTVTATTTSYVPTKASSDTRRSQPTAVCGMGLVPLGDGSAEDGLFGSKKPSLSFTPHAQSDILVRVSNDVKHTWLAKDCLVATASRLGEDRIEVTVLGADDGILLRFPKKEARGVVELSLEATCRPRVQKMIKVHFGKGIMEQACEMTKNLAYDLSVLVPAAAQEAGRRLVEAKRCLGAVSDSIGSSVAPVADIVLGRLGGALSTAQESFWAAKTDVVSRIKGAAGDVEMGLGVASKLARERLHETRGVQSMLQLNLLRAQVSAKAWWLKATGRSEKHDDYKRKAREYVTSKYAAALEAAGRVRWPRQKTEAPSRPWSRMLRQGDCQRTFGRGRRSTHECSVVG